MNGLRASVEFGLPVVQPFGPLTVYHGTPTPWRNKMFQVQGKTLDGKMLGEIAGLHATEDKALAEQFGEVVMPFTVAGRVLDATQVPARHDLHVLHVIVSQFANTDPRRHDWSDVQLLQIARAANEYAERKDIAAIRYFNTGDEVPEVHDEMSFLVFPWVINSQLED